MVTRARKPGMWTAVGAGAGIALGTALGNTPVGLALGAALGIGWALFTARARKQRCRP
jgi:hypothetical protein